MKFCRVRETFLIKRKEKEEIKGIGGKIALIFPPKYGKKERERRKLEKIQKYPRKKKSVKQIYRVYFEK